MKIEVLIRLEGDPEPESDYLPDMLYVHRVDSLSIPPEVGENLPQIIGAIAQQVEDGIDAATSAARSKLAVMADHAAVS